MHLPDEPKGWQRLQAMAQNAPDTESLVRIIDEMYSLLDRHERDHWQTISEIETEPASAARKPAMAIEVQMSQSS